MNAPKQPMDTPSPFTRKLFLRLLGISCVISLLFISVLGLNADQDILFSAIDTTWLATAIAAMIFLQLHSGIRLFLLLPKKSVTTQAPLVQSTRVMFSFQAIIKLLPFRLGEVGFFWLSRRYLGLAFQDNLGIFLNLRIWDLRIVSSSFLIFGGLELHGKVPWGRPVFIIVGLFGLLLFSLSSGKLIKLAELALRIVHKLFSFRWTDALANSLSEASSTLVKSKTRWSSLVNGLFAIATWSNIYLIYHCLYSSVGVDIGWFATIMVVSGMVLVGALPIQTLGGIGLLEFGQASLLVLSGLTTTTAASKSLAVGTLYFGLCTGVPALLAITYYLGERLLPSKRRHRP